MKQPTAAQRTALDWVHENRDRLSRDHLTLWHLAEPSWREYRSAAFYVVRPGQPPVVYAGGFKTITDFAFASDGGLYVLQYATGPVFFSGPGALIRVAPDGTRSTITTALSQPTGIAIGSDGSVYVSNRGGSTGIGEVLRITP